MSRLATASSRSSLRLPLFVRLVNYSFPFLAFCLRILPFVRKASVGKTSWTKFSDLMFVRHIQYKDETPLFRERQPKRMRFYGGPEIEYDLMSDLWNGRTVPFFSRSFCGQGQRNRLGQAANTLRNFGQKRHIPHSILGSVCVVCLIP